MTLITYLRELAIEAMLDGSLRRYFGGFSSDVVSCGSVDDGSVVLDNVYSSKANVILMCL